MRIEGQMEKKEQFQIERKGKGIASILLQGNYDEPASQVRDK